MKKYALGTFLSLMFLTTACQIKTSEQVEEKPATIDNSENIDWHSKSNSGEIRRNT